MCDSGQTTPSGRATSCTLRKHATPQKELCQHGARTVPLLGAAVRVRFLQSPQISLVNRHTLLGAKTCWPKGPLIRIKRWR